MSKGQLTLGSLFDGIGGFPYAASFYGIRALWASEIVPECVSVTKRHFPDMEHVGDITKLDGHTLPPVDIITFGSPCQDLSVASGKRLGLAGERSGLFLEAVRIIREMQEATNGEYPKFALWENVPGALSSSGRRDFKAVLEAFTETEVPMSGSGQWANAGMVRGRGVDLAWCVYDAQYFGTAQRRRRIFLVADFRGERAGEILFVPKSLQGYFEAGGTPRQGLAAYAQDGAGAAGGGLSGRPLLVYENHSQDTRYKGPLDVAPTVSATYGMGGNNQPFVVKGSGDGILNDQGGDSLCVEKGGISPTLRSQTHGNLPITAYAIQGSMIGRADGTGPQGDGINENVSFTLNTIDRHAVCMATGQEEQPPLVAGHEQPIVTHPQIAGTLCASGAGLSRPAGQGNELDFCVVSAGFKHKASNQAGSLGYQEETAPTLLAGQQGAVMKAYVIGAYHSGGMLSDNPKSGFYETDTSRTLDLNGGNPSCNQGGVAIVEEAGDAEAAAVDCRNLRETEEVSGTLLAKAATGGYSLNYQNPVRTGLCVRRLTPTEAERLQGYPDGWTEYGADGRPVSDTKRYQMLGNSIAVPCVAYIMQGIRDAASREGA